ISYRFDVLQTIISELYANALEHGLLNLDSVMKASHEGFAEYYRLREHRLAALDTGWIRIALETFKDKGVIKIRICVEDSGEGFMFKDSAVHSQKTLSQSKPIPWGRGIELVRSF